MKAVAFLGAPGSGKGTQAQFLSERFQIPVISMGELLRREVRSRSPHGMRLKDHIESGAYAPWQEVEPIFCEYLTHIKDKIVLFDGIPRDIQQAEKVSSILKKSGHQIVRAIFLSVPSYILSERILQRRQCAHCGFVLSSTAFCPCPRCKSTDIAQRADDRKEIIEKRLTSYHHNIEPLLNFYRKDNMLHEIDGTRAVEDVQSDLVQAIQNWNLVL